MNKSLIVFLLGSSLFLTACAETAVAPSTDNPGDKKTPTITGAEVPLPAYRIFLVALEDKGQLGKQIGCEDSIVGKDGTTTLSAEDSTQVKMTAAFNELLNLKEKTIGPFKLDNSLAGSSLKLDSLTVENGKATVNLSGALSLSGVCDNPRFESQLMETALQFSDVKEASILINQTPLKDLLSLK